jgi:hypothetical protein
MLTPNHLKKLFGRIHSIICTYFREADTARENGGRVFSWSLMAPNTIMIY